MGNFIVLVCEAIERVTDFVETICSWVRSIAQKIKKKVQEWMETQRNKVESADDPESVGKIMIARKYAAELGREASSLGKTLSSSDKAAIENCL